MKTTNGNRTNPVRLNEVLTTEQLREVMLILGSPLSDDAATALLAYLSPSTQSLTARGLPPIVLSRQLVALRARLLACLP